MLSPDHALATNKNSHGDDASYDISLHRLGILTPIYGNATRALTCMAPLRPVDELEFYCFVRNQSLIGYSLKE